MAKGFTVKANTPKKKKPDWDIDAIKARMKGKTIVFCLPGRGCSFIFLKTLCNYALTWFRMECLSKLVRTILPWLTLHVVSV